MFGGMEAMAETLVDPYAGANTDMMMVQIVLFSEAMAKAKL